MTTRREPPKIPELEELRSAAEVVFDYLSPADTVNEPAWARRLREALEGAKSYADGTTRRGVGTCDGCNTDDVERVPFPQEDRDGMIPHEEHRLWDLCRECRHETCDRFEDALATHRKVDEVFGDEAPDFGALNGAAGMLPVVQDVARVLDAGGMTAGERLAAITERVRAADCGVYLPPVPAALAGGSDR